MAASTVLRPCEATELRDVSPAAELERGPPSGRGASPVDGPRAPRGGSVTGGAGVGQSLAGAPTPRGSGAGASGDCHSRVGRRPCWPSSRQDSAGARTGAGGRSRRPGGSGLARAGWGGSRRRTPPSHVWPPRPLSRVPGRGHAPETGGGGGRSEGGPVPPRSSRAPVTRSGEVGRASCLGGNIQDVKPDTAHGLLCCQTPSSFERFWGFPNKARRCATCLSLRRRAPIRRSRKPVSDFH
jgi:hypothetical protein